MDFLSFAVEEQNIVNKIKKTFLTSQRYHHKVSRNHKQERTDLGSTEP